MPQAVRRGGKKNRKHGRWSRAPSMRAYVATNRLVTNRARRLLKEKKRRERARRKALLRRSSKMQERILA